MRYLLHRNEWGLNAFKAEFKQLWFYQEAGI